MTTRRDALKMTAGAGLATLGMKSLPASATAAAPEPFDFDTHKFTFAAAIVDAGVDRESHDRAYEAFLKLIRNGTPLPAEFAAERERCRNVLLAVLSRLDA